MTDSTFLRAAKALKHALFLLRKRISRTVHTPVGRATNFALTTAGRFRTYQFDPDRYRGSFIVTSLEMDSEPADVPEVLYLFWLGGSEMSPARRSAVERARQLNPSMDVRLLTDDSIETVLVDEAPLHPAYQHLALTHRADYLRAYVMHHHGGGYLDVKTIGTSWEGAFQRLQASRDSWALGYRELGHLSTTSLPGKIQDDVRRNFFRIIGTSGFIFRPGTTLTGEWFEEVCRRLNYYQDLVERNPGGVRGGEGGNESVPKHALLGDVLAPLALKYHKRLIIDDSIRPSFENYL